MLLLQGQYCSRYIWQMSRVFTHNALKQASLQESKALEFVTTLHQLYCLLSGVLIPPTHIATPEVAIENRYTYKQQEDYLCFDRDFDNNDHDDKDDDDETPTTTPTTPAADLLLTLINQIPSIPSPTPPASTPTPFNFSYIKVNPTQTTTVTTVPCDKSGTTVPSTAPLERITSYSLLVI